MLDWKTNHPKLFMRRCLRNHNDLYAHLFSTRPLRIVKTKCFFFVFQLYLRYNVVLKTCSHGVERTENYGYSFVNCLAISPAILALLNVTSGSKRQGNHPLVP